MHIAQYLREEGQAQGRAEGVQQEAMRIAKVMLEKGMEPGVVASLTGIPVEMVEKARH